MDAPKTRFYIQTYGCQMNVADSERMAALLEQQGAEPVAAPEAADVILLNTCSVRERPEHKVYSRLGEFRRLKRQKPGLVIGVCGCQAQREGEAILANAPFVDLVVGTANVARVPELVRQAGSWTFVNFHYGSGKDRSDLLGILKKLRQERLKQRR